MEAATHAMWTGARRQDFTLPIPKLGLLERRVILFAGDQLVLSGTLWLVTQYSPRPAWLGLSIAPAPQLIWFVVLGLLWTLIAPLLECYDLVIAGNRFAGPYRAVAAGLLSLIAYSLIPFVTPAVMQSRLVHSVLVVSTLLSVSIWRTLFAAFLGQALPARRALIVGAGVSGERMFEALRQHGAHAYTAIGIVEDCEREQRVVAEHPALLGSATDLQRVIDATGADELIVCSDGALSDEAYRAITSAYEAGVRVTTMAQLYEELTGRIPVEHIGDQWITVLPQASPAHASYALVKRFLDVAGALLGLAITAVVFLPLSIAILLDSGWPVIFSQERVGRRGRTFLIYKFRTVASQNSRSGTFSIWERKATKPTRLGTLLRKSRIDELPQFWNVLKGEMSLVGPRPFVPEEVAELQQHIPFFRSRLLVRPGLTGWAQIKAHYGTKMADELEKLQYDLYYVRHQSLALDLMILLKTIAVVLRLAGR